MIKHLKRLLLASLLVCPLMTHPQSAMATRQRYKMLLDPYPSIAQGLPEQLPGDFADSTDWVSFTLPEGGVSAPLGMGITFDGQPVRGKQQLHEVFSERFLARLPHGQQIRILQAPPALAGKPNSESWDYPVGTQVVHLVSLQPDQKRIYELRMIQKLPDGRWAYGMYAPIDGSRENEVQGLALQRYAGLRSDEFQVKLSPQRAVQVGLKHVNLMSCRICHANMSLSPQQYASQEEAGPCGFVPDNPGLKESWRARYLQSQGSDPFVVDPLKE